METLERNSIDTIFLVGLVDRPDKDLVVSTTGQEHFAVLVFVLGMTSHDASHPTVVALKHAHVSHFVFVVQTHLDI